MQACSLTAVRDGKVCWTVKVVGFLLCCVAR